MLCNLYSLSRCICRSYHDGEHYNSVRLKEDSCSGPARPIIIKVLYHFIFLILGLWNNMIIVIHFWIAICKKSNNFNLYKG